MRMRDVSELIAESTEAAAKSGDFRVYRSPLKNGQPVGPAWLWCGRSENRHPSPVLPSRGMMPEVRHQTFRGSAMPRSGHLHMRQPAFPPVAAGDLGFR